MKNNKKLKNGLISIAKAILATLLYIVGIELIGAWFLISEVIDFEYYYKYYALIQGVLQLLGIMIFIYFVKRRTLKSLVKKTQSNWYLLAIPLGVSFLFMQTPLNWFYNLLFETEYHITYRFDGLSKLMDINLISLILLIPIGEELFFREYIQNNLQKKTNKFGAIFSTSILFALIHLPLLDLIFESSKQDWHLFYMTFFGGILTGVLYYKSKSIGPSIILHVFWNLMVTIA